MRLVYKPSNDTPASAAMVSYGFDTNADWFDDLVTISLLASDGAGSRLHDAWGAT